jgi:hypothetical protein
VLREVRPKKYSKNLKKIGKNQLKILCCVNKLLFHKSVVAGKLVKRVVFILVLFLSRQSCLLKQPRIASVSRPSEVRSGSPVSGPEPEPQWTRARGFGSGPDLNLIKSQKTCFYVQYKR